MQTILNGAGCLSILVTQPCRPCSSLSERKFASTMISELSLESRASVLGRILSIIPTSYTNATIGLRNTSSFISPSAPLDEYKTVAGRSRNPL